MDGPQAPNADFDPYFVLDDPKATGEKGASGAFPGDDQLRRELLPTESAFRLAGTLGMILGASTFALFGVPVSFMLKAGGEPGGILGVEDGLWRRWVARMVLVLTVAIIATSTSWGLRWNRPWTRWALIAVGVAPPMAWLVRLVLRLLSIVPPNEHLDDIGGMTCASLTVLPASLTAIVMACSRRGRAVLSPEHESLIVRTPKLAPGVRMGLRAGLGLTLAMVVLYWTLLLIALGFLVALGIIRSI